MNTSCFLSSSRAIPTARLTLPRSLQPQPPSNKTCHAFLCQQQASGPRERSPRGGGVKHREFRQQAKMNGPVLTPGFHQFLKTLLRAKKPTTKPTQPPPSLYLAIHYVPRPQGPATVCRAHGSSAGKGLCSARQLCLGTIFRLPAAMFSHSVASEGGSADCPGLGQAALLQLSSQSMPVTNALLQPLASFHEGRGCSFPTYLVLEDPALPLESTSRDG